MVLAVPVTAGPAPVVAVGAGVEARVDLAASPLAVAGHLHVTPLGVLAPALAPRFT